MYTKLELITFYVHDGTNTCRSSFVRSCTGVFACVASFHFSENEIGIKVGVGLRHSWVVGQGCTSLPCPSDRNGYISFEKRAQNRQSHSLEQVVGKLNVRQDGRLYERREIFSQNLIKEILSNHTQNT